MYYRKLLWGVFYYMMLLVLWEVTVGHIAYGRLHIREYVFPDVTSICNIIMLAIQVILSGMTLELNVK